MSFLSLLVPGSALLLTKRNMLAFSIPLLGLGWVLVMSLTRWVIIPNGFMVMLVGLFTLHVASYLWGILSDAKKRPVDGAYWIKFILIISLNIIFTLGCHLLKDRLLGFAFYHIPSQSMRPTLIAGDVILADTWALNDRAVSIDDVIVVKRSAHSMLLVKRLKKTRFINNQMELFIEGDNTTRSVDSRNFGWIPDDFVVGKAQFVWFSFTIKGRSFIDIQ